MEPTEEMNDELKRIADEFGYKEITLSYDPLAEGKITWQRSYDWIHMHMADYFEELPTDMQLELILRVMHIIKGDEPDPVSNELNAILNSKAFRERNVDRFIERHGKSKPISEYKNVCFKNRIKELIEEGCLNKKDVDKITFRISRNDPESDKLVRGSMMFKVAFIDKRLDRKHIPDYVIKYLLLKGIAPLIGDYRIGDNIDMEDKIHQISRRYSRYIDALKWLMNHKEIYDYE